MKNNNFSFNFNFGKSLLDVINAYFLNRTFVNSKKNLSMDSLVYTSNYRNDKIFVSPAKLLKKFLIPLLLSMTFPFLLHNTIQAEAFVLDFDDLPQGDIVSSQFLKTNGVTISAKNFGNGPGLAIIFDSLNPTGGDNDLAGPPWDGGNLASGTTVLGKILIIAENDVDVDFDGLIDFPDDEGNRPAGSIFFDFENPMCSVGFDLIDVEGPSEFGRNSGFVATFFMGGSELARVGFDQFINENSMFFDPTVEYGNNKANRISPLTVDALSKFTGTSITAFDKVEFNLGGSSAIDNIDVSSCQTPIVDEFIDNEIQRIVAEPQIDQSVSLQNILSSPEKIEELEKKINFLEDKVREKNEEITKKDSVLREQLKVISDLVNMIKNAIFEPLESLFSKF